MPGTIGEVEMIQTDSSAPSRPGPRLQLDELLDQLVVDARVVQQSHGRLRVLMQAAESITSELSLDAVLVNIVDAARGVVVARGAGLVGYADGVPRHLAHRGVPDDVVAMLEEHSDSPLRRIVDAGGPVRAVADATVPDFLGVPVQVDGRLYGCVYLLEADLGRFTDEDEQVLAILAYVAGTAIRKAMLYGEAQTRQRWLAASARVAGDLMSFRGNLLEVVTASAIDLVGADLAVVAVRDGDDGWVEIAAASGDGADVAMGLRVDLSASDFGQVISGNRVIRVVSLADEEPEIYASVGLPVGPALLCPIANVSGLRGIFALARAVGAAPYTELDEEMATDFAGHAALALQLAESRAMADRLVVLDDRERIAMDLHDHVIQELFAVGMDLEAIGVSQADDPDLVRGLRDRADGLDNVIRRVRHAIRDLRDPSPAG